MGKPRKANRTLLELGRQHMRIDKGVSFLFLFGFGLSVLPGIAQTAEDRYPENPTPQVNVPSKAARLGRLPIEWIIGPYIPAQGQLETLSNSQRGQIYVRQTFLTAGSYVARAFSAGLDQARGEPPDWGGGSLGYGRRAYYPEETLCSGMSLGTTFAVATGSGVALAMLFRETLLPMTGVSVPCDRKSRCIAGLSQPARCITHGCRGNTTFGQAVRTMCWRRPESAVATIS